MLTSSRIAEAEKQVGYHFSCPELLCTALTHTSYANEHGGTDNERLEFLGDSILNFVITERLYKTCQVAEGDLTAMRAALVSRKPLGHAVERMGILPFYQCGEGMKRESNVSEKFKANLFEALLAAIYLDSGNLEVVADFVERQLWEPMRQTRPEFDYKSMLQRYLQQQKIAWHYETQDLPQGGFCAHLQIEEQTFTGTGRTKRAAEQNAAGEACAQFGCMPSIP